MRLVRVIAPHFVAGFIVDERHVVSAAPILRYLVGLPKAEAWRRLKRTGWGVEAV